MRASKIFFNPIFNGLLFVILLNVGMYFIGEMIFVDKYNSKLIELLDVLCKKDLTVVERTQLEARVVDLQTIKSHFTPFMNSVYISILCFSVSGFLGYPAGFWIWTKIEKKERIRKLVNLE